MATLDIVVRKHQRPPPLGGYVQFRGVDWLRPQKTFFSRTLLVNMGRGDLSG